MSVASRASGSLSVASTESRGGCPTEGYGRRSAGIDRGPGPSATPLPGVAATAPIHPCDRRCRCDRSGRRWHDQWRQSVAGDWPSGGGRRAAPRCQPDRRDSPGCRFLAAPPFRPASFPEGWRASVGWSGSFGSRRTASAAGRGDSRPGPSRRVADTPDSDGADSSRRSPSCRRRRSRDRWRTRCRSSSRGTGCTGR